MKLKINIVLFLMVVVLSGIGFANADAAPSRGIVGFLAEIGAGKTYTSKTWTKGQDFNAQSYQFQKATTTITSPCPKCKFKVTLYKNNNSKMGSITGKTGDNYYFDNKLNQLSASEGDYHITIKRADVTAVTSWETGDWYIASANSLAKYNS